MPCTCETHFWSCTTFVKLNQLKGPERTIYLQHDDFCPHGAEGKDKVSRKSGVHRLLTGFVLNVQVYL